jgi:hypothetical protein
VFAVLLRGLRWRPGASLAVLAVALVASTAAAVGPLYARSSEESLVAERLAKAPIVNTAVEVRATSIGQRPRLDEQRVDGDQLEKIVTRELASTPALDPSFGPVSSWITVPPSLVTRADGPLGPARTSWHPGACSGVRLVAGRCIRADDEALVSSRLLSDYRMRLGERLTVAITGPPAAVGRPAGRDPRVVVVVGTYDIDSADPQVWGSRRPARLREGPLGNIIEIDEILLSRAKVGAVTEEVDTVAFRLLRPTVTTLEQVDATGDATRATLAELETRQGEARRRAPDSTAVWTPSSGLPQLLDDMSRQRGEIRSLSLVVAAQLVLLSWFVLFLVVAATTEERAGEVALAKLRGLGLWRTTALGLAEVTLLLAVATPLGLLVGLLADRALVGAALRPGTTAAVDGTTVVAVVAGLLGAIVASALAVRRFVVAPVLDQLRRTGGTRAALARSFAVDAVALALAAEGVYLLRRGGEDPIALLTPGLLALAAGLLAVRLLPLLSRIEVRRTRASTRIASFLAVRNVARRPGGARLVVLLTVSTALGVFSVSSWSVASAVRADRARQEVAAAEVLHVTAASPTALLSAVRRADPGGRWAMAAVQVASTSTGPVLAVDTPRLAAVTSWDPGWAGTDAGAVLAALRPPVGQPVRVRERVGVTATTTLAPASTPVQLVVRLERADGVQTAVPVATLTRGQAVHTVRLRDCAQPCRLLGFVLQGTTLGNTYGAGEVTITAIADGGGRVADHLAKPSAWRVVPAKPGIDASFAPATRTLEAGAGGLTASFDQLSTNDTMRIDVADHPATVAALVGSGTTLEAVSGSRGSFFGSDLSGENLVVQPAGRGVLPRLGREGMLVDLEYVAATSTRTRVEADPQVWLAAAAPPSVRAALTAAGLAPGTTESLAERRAELDRDGTALALLLFLVAAIVATVLSTGTVLALSFVSGRRRSYELAALRSLGAPTRVLVRAGRREQVFLVVVGVLLGTVTGVAATLAALTALPAITGAGLAPVERGPQPLPVALFVVAVLGLVTVVAHLGARRVVAGARADLLRESQA